MSIPSWCRVGARVVCIKADRWEIVSGTSTGAETQPHFGEVCVISGIDPVPFGGSVFVTLSGYDARVDGYFNLKWFRPAVDDDIEATLYNSKKRQHVQRIPMRGTVS